MCIIAALEPENTITEKEFDSMWSNNKDGGGLVSVRKGVFTVEKSLDREEFKEKVFGVLKRQPDAYTIIHFRMANIGSVSLENCHPFKVNKRYWMVHNGTISGNGINQKHKENKSDTRQFAEMLHKLPWNFMENETLNYFIGDYLGSMNKVVLLDRAGYPWIFNRNHTSSVQEKGRWFSNSSFREERKSSVNQGSFPNQNKAYNYQGSYSPIKNCPICLDLRDELYWDTVKNTCSYCSTSIERLSVELELTWAEAKNIYISYFDSDDFKSKLSKSEKAILRPNYIPEEEWNTVLDGDYETEEIAEGVSIVRPKAKKVHELTDDEWAQEDLQWMYR